MRRFATPLLLLFLTTAAFASTPWNESNPRTPGKRIEGLRHVLVHAAGPLTEADRTELAAKGVFIQRATTRGRYFARVAEGRVAADPRVTAIEPIAIEKKISRSAYREVTGGRTWAELNVFFHDDVEFDDARQALLSAGAAIDPLLVEYTRPNRITVKIAPQSLNALAADDRILGVTGPIRFKVRDDNAKSAALSHVDVVHAAPYGLTGQGVTVSLFELAPAQADHPEFGGRLTVAESVTGGSSSNKTHATHVAGTIAAAGLREDAKGMAPAARIFQFCVRSGSNTCKNDFVKDKDEELPKLGSIADNNSWGYVLGWSDGDFQVWNDSEEFWGAYELELVSPLDQISLDRNILFIHSAGNDGNQPNLSDWGQHRHVDENFDVIRDKLWCYSQAGNGTDCPAFCTGGCESVKHHTETPFDTIGLTASGKNTIAVGAVAAVGTSLDIASFSSRGPAKDGRVKPDVVARGFAVLSTVPTNSYGPNQGTSMAAPLVTGVSALLVEQWRKTFGTDPNPVQLKALIVGGADDIGNPGPDYTYGFGLVNAQTAADFVVNDQGTGRRIRNLTMNNGGTSEFPLIVESAQPNLKVILQWGDPSQPLLPGEIIADKALVNDLDLKLVGPDGTVHLPWVLDKVNYQANATKGVNTVDNTEIVEVKNAPAGVYRAVITGTTVLEGPQAAVLLSSVRTAAPCSDLTENRNDNASAPYGDLVSGQTIFAGLCSSTDVDHFRFLAEPGAARITFVTGDTALKVTLTGGLNTTATIPANTTQTINGTVAGSGPVHVNLKVEPSGTVGAEPQYHFTPNFDGPNAPRRRSIRK